MTPQPQGWEEDDFRKYRHIVVGVPGNDEVFVAYDVVKEALAQKDAEKAALVMEVMEIIEKTIQEERYSGAPFALNKVLTAIAEKHNVQL